MTKEDIRNLLHKMLDNYMGAFEDCTTLWDEPDSHITLDKATEILNKEINGG